MFGRCEAMQHKAMHDIFRKGQRNDTTGEKHSVITGRLPARTLPVFRRNR
jgi:hypothetical protein